MDCIANDFESFSLIAGEVRDWGLERGLVLDEIEIAEALRELLRSGYANAYELTPAGPPVEIFGQLNDLSPWYFHLSPEGKNAIVEY